MPQVSDNTGYFGIARWQAWAPGVTDTAAWQRWLPDGHSPEPEAQPDVSYLPGLLRRRLDRPGRMALSTAWPCAEGLDSVPCVFASRHGVLARTLELLTALAQDEPLSPTSFSLSVHNSNAGLFSIARGDRAAATAIAAGRDSLGMSLLEGANLIAEGADQVLVCYADDDAPAQYSPFVQEDASHRPFAVSLLLTQAADPAQRCRLSPSEETPHETPEAALMRLLLDKSDSTIVGVDQPWRLERAHD
ncbi:MAG TPA: beta-ketoacyl synthase chain length factor [Gammaproteobacteria bacterium]|nr:beta-ketoacyl synthase chain length factor [Gammaproteobacteria bacterium]